MNFVFSHNKMFYNLGNVDENEKKIQTRFIFAKTPAQNMWESDINAILSAKRMGKYEAASRANYWYLR